MTSGRFAYRVQAALLLQEVHRATMLVASIQKDGEYYVVVLSRPDSLRPPIATLRSWADWESWKLSHPDLVLGQLHLSPPTE